MKNKRVQYIVEGEIEKHFINGIKNEYIASGRIRVFNITQNEIEDVFIRTLNENTTVVLVFDIDILSNIHKAWI